MTNHFSLARFLLWISSIALVSNHLGIFRPDSVCLRESI